MRSPAGWPELLELMQIPQLAGRRPGQLSGGQQQRVALARALATSPELMLMDEPFGALDPLVRKDIRNWLRGLHTQLGLTSIFITHDQGEAVELADRVAVMRGGRILQIGTPDELEENPAAPFVFEFLGPTIRLEGVIRGRRLPCVRPAGAAVPSGGVQTVRPWRCCASTNWPLIPNGGEAVVMSARKVGPLVHHMVECRGRTMELVSTEEALPPGSRCSLVMSAATIFSQSSTRELAPAEARLGDGVSDGGLRRARIRIVVRLSAAATRQEHRTECQQCDFHKDKPPA